MDKKWKIGLSGGIVLALIVSIVALTSAGADIQEMGVTNLSSLHLSDTGGTATPVFVANQDGTGRIWELQDATTPVVYVDDGGGLRIVSGGLTVTSGGATITAGGVTVTAGGMTLSDGDAVIADDLRVGAQSSIQVANTTSFTPTGTCQVITATTEVTPTIATGGATAGDFLLLTNESSNTINLADSGTTKLSAAWAGGQYDVLVLWFDGTNWLEVSRSDN